MSDLTNHAYGLTVLCPLKRGVYQNIPYASLARDRLQDLGTDEASPMAKVPNTYLSRFFILNDVFYQGGEPGPKKSSWFTRWKNRLLNGIVSVREDHLKSKYLVFTSNFYAGADGDLDTYLRGMWDHAEKEVRHIFEFCVGFDGVEDASAFVAYLRKCQVRTTFFFNGSVSPDPQKPGADLNDEPLDIHLKALYLKQEFSDFVYSHQGLDDEQLQAGFRSFIERTRPAGTSGPTWKPGMTDLH